MTNKEAFIKEYRSVYLEDPNFENVNDLDLYSWWQWACDWQKRQDQTEIEELRQWKEDCLIEWSKRKENTSAR